MKAKRPGEVRQREKGRGECYRGGKRGGEMRIFEGESFLSYVFKLRMLVSLPGMKRESRLRHPQISSSLLRR